MTNQLPPDPYLTGNNNPHNTGLRERSGRVNINSKLVAFLYTLIRDHLPLGVIEELVRDSQEPDCYYTNGWLAKYAQDLAIRLNETPKAESTIEYEKPKERSEKIKERIETLAELKSELKIIEQEELREQLNTHVPGAPKQAQYGYPSFMQHTPQETSRKNPNPDIELQGLFSKKS
jgi:hypothetical protein